MQKLKLLLLDADVIIFAHEIGVWDRVVKASSVSVTQTVLSEAVYWRDKSGERHLKGYVRDDWIKAIPVPLSRVIHFRARFDPVYLDSMDPGETESLAFLDSSGEKWMFCSGDKIVYRILGCLARGEQGISLEEVLKSCGLTISDRKKLRHYNKAFRERCTQMGVNDAITGRGFIQD